MALTTITETILHSIAEWEENAKNLPVKIEFRECFLDHGRVTKFLGSGVIDGKKRSMTWKEDGKCYYKGRRIADYDIIFNS